jgi:hypothetical protein
MGLHYLYLTSGHSRLTERLLEMARNTVAVLVHRGLRSSPAFCSAALLGAKAAYDDRGPLVASSEAGWWAVAAQATFALAAWYGLQEHPTEDAAVATGLHRSIRAGVTCMFGDGPASTLLDLATGDGAGDLLKLVAKVHVGLEVQP